MRAATIVAKGILSYLGFYSRYPYGQRQTILISSTNHFYSRHPCGQRRDNLAVDALSAAFLFTLPVRVATAATSSPWPNGFISIHATRVGSDCGTLFAPAIARLFLFTPPVRVATPPYCNPVLRTDYFYSRHPCGWRLGQAETGSLRNLFLFTPPIRAATSSWLSSQRFCDISIHATCTGGDHGKTYILPDSMISIHATCTGGDVSPDGSRIVDG